MSVCKVDRDWRGVLRRGSKLLDRAWVRAHPITAELLESGVLEGRVLDAGCGVGVRASIASGRCEVVGLDLSPVAAGYASREHGGNFLAGDVTALPFADGAFDNSYSLAVVEHVKAAVRFLKEMRRVTRGRLFLSVTEKDYHGHPDHVHVFDAGKLKRTVTAGGWKLERLYVKNHVVFALLGT